MLRKKNKGKKDWKEDREKGKRKLNFFAATAIVIAKKKGGGTRMRIMEISVGLLCKYVYKIGIGLNRMSRGLFVEERRGSIKFEVSGG